MHPWLFKGGFIAIMGAVFTAKSKQAYTARTGKTSLRTFISPQFVKEFKRNQDILFKVQSETYCSWQGTAVDIFSTRASCSYFTSVGLVEQSAFSGRSVDIQESS